MNQPIPPLPDASPYEKLQYLGLLQTYILEHICLTQRYVKTLKDTIGELSPVAAFEVQKMDEHFKKIEIAFLQESRSRIQEVSMQVSPEEILEEGKRKLAHTQEQKQFMCEHDFTLIEWKGILGYQCIKCKLFSSLVPQKEKGNEDGETK